MFRIYLVGFFIDFDFLFRNLDYIYINTCFRIHLKYIYLDKGSFEFQIFGNTAAFGYKIFE